MPQTIAQNPRMLAIYDRDKNRKDPSEIAASSRAPIYWKCVNTCPGEEDCKHEWIAQPQTVRYSKACPFCGMPPTRPPCCIRKSVAGNPILSAMWYKERNDVLCLYAEKLRCASTKSAWWKCDKICNVECKHQWKTSIQSIHKLPSCPFCSGHRACCMQKSAAKNIVLYNSFDRDHPGNRGINLETLTPYSHRQIWWICHNNCDSNCHHSWKTSVNSRSRKSSCPYCSSKSSKPCCIKKSLGAPEYAETMKDFDHELYRQYTLADFFPHSDKELLWKCHICGDAWLDKIKAKAKSRSGCIKHRCTTSYGELACEDTLRKLDIPFLSQFKLISTRRYDFQFNYNNINYLVEFDGSQHFKRWRNESESDFRYRQNKDIEKTHTAILHNFFMIRIDYTYINRVEQCLLEAFECQKQGAKFYLSSPDMYSFLNLTNK
jgi:hypothetical protein